MKTTLTALVLATAATGALAQVTVTEYRSLEDDAFVIQPWGVAAGELDDMDVYGANGEEIGEVEEVVVDASGTVIGISVEAGGFLGLGEKEVVMPLGDISYVDGRLTTALTEEAIEALPEWDS